MTHTPSKKTLFLIGLIFIGCGDDTKIKKYESVADASAREPDESLESSTQTLSWTLPCGRYESSPPPSQTQHHVFASEGSHNLPLAKTTIEIKGKSCQPWNILRDVVFVIDTSEAMLQGSAPLDPIVGGRCARLDALTTFLGNLPGPDVTRVAITTIGDVATTPKFTLTKDLPDPATLAQILCKENGTFDLTAALAGTHAAVSNMRPSASKEIYLISSGAMPETTDTALAEVDSIKKTATIAALTFSDLDGFYREKIASLGNTSNPRHAVITNTVQLVGGIRSFSTLNLVSQAVTFGGANLTPVRTAIDLNAASYTFQPISIDPALHPNGLSLELEVTTAFGTTIKRTSSLTWNNAENP